MNELEFRRHLKDLVHGHHRPEEHDWNEPGAAPRAAAPPKKSAVRARTKQKTRRAK